MARAAAATERPATVTVPALAAESGCSTVTGPGGCQDSGCVAQAERRPRGQDLPVGNCVVELELSELLVHKFRVTVTMI